MVFARTVCIVHLARLSWKTAFVLLQEILLSLLFVKFSCLLLSVSVDGFVVVVVIVIVVVIVVVVIVVVIVVVAVVVVVVVVVVVADVVIVYYYSQHILLCLPVARNIGGSIKIVADLFVSFFITIRTSQV